MDDKFYIGIDVGSRSVRAGLFNGIGELIAHHSHPITVFNPDTDHFEQSSDEIWKHTCSTVKKVAEHIEDKSKICGIGVDATCSLVVLDENMKPVTVNGFNVEGDDSQNVIMWMDHRAGKQAKEINTSKHNLLKYVGGSVSLEMQMPKLLWLKDNLPSTWNRAHHFLDLPDFLTYRITGSLSRSFCSLVCKWNYKSDGITNKWSDSFLKKIRLGDLIDNNYSKLGNIVRKPGQHCGDLCATAAIEMGLPLDIPVATSLIDAHAGYLGLVASDIDNNVSCILALICGTSTCHMIENKDSYFVPGIWGPYHNAILPNLWLSEGGQSATGALVDHIINSHPATKTCPIKDKYFWIEGLVEKMANDSYKESPCLLTKDFHVYPDFHGNRSPLSDPDMKGMISGLTLDSSNKSLALLYIATIQALAYETRQIIEQLRKDGHTIKTVYMCGGLSNSKLYIQTHANILGLPIYVPKMQESVLLGAAMLGCAATMTEGLESEEVKAMASDCDIFTPNSAVKKFHEKKYQVYKHMQSSQLKYREIMDS